MLALSTSATTLDLSKYTFGGNITRTGLNIQEEPNGKLYCEAGDGYITIEMASGDLLVRLYDAEIYARCSTDK